MWPVRTAHPVSSSSGPRNRPIASSTIAEPAAGTKALLWRSFEDGANAAEPVSDAP